MPLELEGVMLLLPVRIKDLEVPVWLGFVNKLAVNIFFGISFINRFVRGILPSIREGTLRKSRTVFISAIGR